MKKIFQHAQLVIFSILLLSILGSAWYLVSLKNTMKNLDIEKKELLQDEKKYSKENESSKVKLQKTDELFFKEVTGFEYSTIESDKELLLEYLNNLFTWTSGNQYNNQRAIISQVNADGTDSILKELMTKNYAVSVYDNNKILKTNVIDKEGYKSILTTYTINQTDWDINSEIVYVARVAYQVYIDEDDLDGEFKTINSVLLTFHVSGDEQNRKITKVSFDNVV